MQGQYFRYTPSKILGFVDVSGQPPDRRVRVEYTIGETKYQESVVLKPNGREFLVGEEISIVCHPDDPRRCEMWPTDKQTETGIVTTVCLILGIVLLVLGAPLLVYGVVQTLSKRKEHTP